MDEERGASRQAHHHRLAIAGASRDALPRERLGELVIADVVEEPLVGGVASGGPRDGLARERLAHLAADRHDLW